jgi:hypothetical protein
VTSAEYKRQWYQKNREKILAKYRLRNKTAKAEYDKKRREIKGDELRAYDRERAKTPERKATKREWSRRRNMTLKQATPNWLSELDKLFIKEIYHLAVLRSEALGIEFDVDHIVPLHGKTVCGLHVPSNLQLLPRSQNITKKNYFELV